MNGNSSIEKKVLEGRRLSDEDGLYLLTKAPLIWLGRLANEARFRKLPHPDVTFVMDANPNYTNICDTDCHFCAFFRRPKNPDAYTLTVEQVMEKIERSRAMGVTTILLQGGHNRDLRLDYYTSLVHEARRRFPGITPHFFTASEIQTIASVEGLTVEDVLRRLNDAGQFTLPGGGAEILTERVRKKLAPKKGGPDAWLSVHRAAHKLGWKSTATMMYGHIEEPADVVEHWNRIRDLQDEFNGFTAFIPWSFKPDNTVLQRKFPRRAGPVPYLRMLAAARIYLDNFLHIQSSWFSEGKKTGQAGLHFGADDFGGTLYEENVHAEAGFVNTISLKELIALIHESGFDAVQRTTTYDRLKKFPRGGAAADDAPSVSLRKNQATEAAVS